jgi:hypothetical protein
LFSISFPEKPFEPTDMPRVGGELVSRLTQAMVTMFAFSIVPVTINVVGMGNKSRCGPNDVFMPQI